MSTTRQVFVGILTFMYLSIVAILFFLHSATLTILIFTLLVPAVLFCVDTNFMAHSIALLNVWDENKKKFDGKKTAACSLTVTI